MAENIGVAQGKEKHPVVLFAQLRRHEECLYAACGVGEICLPVQAADEDTREGHRTQGITRDHHGFGKEAGFARTALNPRSEEHTSELQSLMRISYAVFCLKKKTTKTHKRT